MGFKQCGGSSSCNLSLSSIPFRLGIDVVSSRHLYYFSQRFLTALLGKRTTGLVECVMGSLTLSNHRFPFRYQVTVILMVLTHISPSLYLLPNAGFLFSRALVLWQHVHYSQSNTTQCFGMCWDPFVSTGQLHVRMCHRQLPFPWSMMYR